MVCIPLRVVEKKRAQFVSIGIPTFCRKWDIRRKGTDLFCSYNHKAALLNSPSVCWLFYISYYFDVGNLRDFTFTLHNIATRFVVNILCKYKYSIAF